MVQTARGCSTSWMSWNHFLVLMGSQSWSIWGASRPCTQPETWTRATDSLAFDPFSLILVLVTHDFGCFRVIGYFLPEIHKNNTFILIIKGINNKMIWIKIKMDPFQHLLYFQFELWINDGISPKEYILLSGNSPENHQDLNYMLYINVIKGGCQSRKKKKVR